MGRQPAPAKGAMGEIGTCHYWQFREAQGVRNCHDWQSSQWIHERGGLGLTSASRSCGSSMTGLLRGKARWE